MKIFRHLALITVGTLIFNSSVSAKDLIWREVFANPIEKNLNVVISSKNHLVVSGIGDGKFQQNVNFSKNPISPDWKNWKNFRFDSTEQIIVNQTSNGDVQLSGVSNGRLFTSGLNENGRFVKPQKSILTNGIIDLSAAKTLPPKKRLIGLSANGGLVTTTQHKGKYRDWKTIDSLFSVPGSIATLTNPSSQEQLFSGISQNGVAVISWVPGAGFGEKSVIDGKKMVQVHLGLTEKGRWEIYGIDSSGVLWHSRRLDSGKWEGWKTIAPLAIREVIVTKDSNNTRTLFLLTASDRIFVVQRDSKDAWTKHHEIPSNGNTKEIAVAERANNKFELMTLDHSNYLWHTQFNLLQHTDATAAYAQGPRYPTCTEYLPYNQYIDTWTNRFHMMAATPGAKTQLYYYTGGVINEAFAYSMFLDVTGGLSLAGCQPSHSIMGQLESMGDATNTYDQYGRILTQKGNYSGSAYTMTFSYNNYGFIESIKRNDNICMEATYDVMQRVNSVAIHPTGDCSDIYINKQTILFGYLSTLSSVPNFVHGTSYKDDIPIIIGSGDIAYRDSNFIVDIGVEYEVINSHDTFNLFSFDVSTEVNNNDLQISEVEGRWDGAPTKFNVFFYDTDRYGFQDEINNGVNLEISTIDEQVNYVLFGVGAIGLNYALTYE